MIRLDLVRKHKREYEMKRETGENSPHSETFQAHAVYAASNAEKGHLVFRVPDIMLRDPFVPILCLDFLFRFLSDFDMQSCEFGYIPAQSKGTRTACLIKVKRAR